MQAYDQVCQATMREAWASKDFLHKVAHSNSCMPSVTCLVSVRHCWMRHCPRRRA